MTMGLPKRKNYNRLRRQLKTPYRSSSLVVPQPIKRDKVCFIEYGNDHDEKTGRWLLYVDIISGNCDLVDYVTFRFASSSESHDVYARFPVTLSDGLTVHRFSLRRGSYQFSDRKITISLHGRSGLTKQSRAFKAKAETFRSKAAPFIEPKKNIRSRFLQSPDVDFGVEFEMSCSRGTNRGQIKKYVEGTTKLRLDVFDSYSEGKKQRSNWKLVPDSSLQCSRHDPNCSKFELVSPILNDHNGNGLEQCSKILTAINKATTGLTLNTTMSFHVHINVGNLSFEMIKNVCLNFIKYEKIIDELMPLSRRQNMFCKSNSDDIETLLKYTGSSKKHKAIVDCKVKRYDPIICCCCSVSIYSCLSLPFLPHYQFLRSFLDDLSFPLSLLLSTPIKVLLLISFRT